MSIGIPIELRELFSSIDIRTEIICWLFSCNGWKF